MDAERAESTSRLVGLITFTTGLALTVAPARVGRLSGIEDLRTARWVGLGDLALAPGLVVEKPRWPWMAARAAANLPMAGVFLSSPRRAGRASGIALLVLTVSDVRTALSLHRAGR
jgi:hypothetical protein